MMEATPIPEAAPGDDAPWMALAVAAGLKPLRLRDKTLLPIVQGGMGVGVSASGLASAVARLGAMGTISSVDLRRRHPDLMAQTQGLEKAPDARERIDEANLVALDREIRAAREAAQGRGAIAVNVMKALSAYEAYVRQALESGADALVVGAGLPARAVRTPWLDKYLRILPILQERAHPKARCNMAFDCLQHCGLRDGDATIGQFCIDQQLGHAMTGDARRGLFFRGAGRLPFGDQIRGVADLVRHLLTPAPQAAV